MQANRASMVLAPLAKVQLAYREHVTEASGIRILTAAMVAILLVGRRPESLFHAQLFAEDGPIFYQHALTDGAVRSVFEQYSGYLHVILRLTADLAAALPAIVAPTIFAVVAFSFAIYACSMFASLRFRSIVHSDALRVLICCAFAVVPYADELIGTLTDIQYSSGCARYPAPRRPPDRAPGTPLQSCSSSCPGPKPKRFALPAG
jgi:hypothetical protein